VCEKKIYVYQRAFFINLKKEGLRRGVIAHLVQTPFWQVFLEKSPPHLLPEALDFPATQVSIPFLMVQRDLVLQGPGLVVEQVDFTGRYVHTDVQHLVLGNAAPESHCSPDSTIPFPQTAWAAPEEKAGGGGTTT